MVLEVLAARALSKENAMASYKVTRTHKEKYVVNNIPADSPEEAVKFVSDNLDSDDFDLIESSPYTYEAVKEKT